MKCTLPSKHVKNLWLEQENLPVNHNPLHLIFHFRKMYTSRYFLSLDLWLNFTWNHTRTYSIEINNTITHVHDDSLNYLILNWISDISFSLSFAMQCRALSNFTNPCMSFTAALLMSSLIPWQSLKTTLHSW